MKKFMLIMLIVCLGATVHAQGLVEQFQQKYGENEDFTIVNITAKMFQMVALAADKEDQSLIKNLTGMKVVSSDQKTETYYADALKILLAKENRMEELMSVKEKNEDVRMFTREEKGIVTELVIAVKDSTDFVLIGFTGNIDLKRMADLSKSIHIDGLKSLEKIKDAKK